MTRLMILAAFLATALPFGSVDALLASPTRALLASSRPAASTFHSIGFSSSKGVALHMKKSKKGTRPGGGGGFGGGFGKKAPPAFSIKTKSIPPNFRYAGDVRPHAQSPTRLVDPAAVLALPDYALDGRPKKVGDANGIEVKSPEQIAKMRAAGRAAREVLDLAGAMVEAGVTSDAIDAAVHAAAIERGAYPSPLNYRSVAKCFIACLLVLIV